MNELKLIIELVPSSAFYSNVRSEVSRKEWDIIRKEVYKKAGHKCEICGDVGPKHAVEAHEIWSYNDRTLIQKLEGMIALCPSCHQVKHFGFAQISGNGEKALKHFIKINKLTKKQAEKEIKKAFDIWAERSKKSWELDISLLKNYGINVDKLKKSI